jgi:MFS family permease
VIKTYPKDFWLLSTSMFCFMLSFNLILPEMNQFISQLGGASYKGAIIFLFSIAAGISRPFAGKLSDLIGRKKTMNIGLIITIVVSLSYPFTRSLGLLFALRFIHGLSAGFSPTSATALLTDLLPEKKRGAAMGIWGTFISLGIGVGQALGSYIFSISNYNTLFLSAALFGCLAIVFSALIQETLTQKTRFTWSMLKLKGHDIIEKPVKPAAIIMFLTAISSGMIFVLTPDVSAFLNISNKGYFFGIYVLTTIVMRLFFSSLSDRLGREKTLLIGCLFLILSMSMLATAGSFWTYTMAAAVFGLATGVSSPTLFAWTADLSLPERRGTGSGTMFIALEGGILFGSGLTFVFYKNTLVSAQFLFWLAAGFAIIACLALLNQLKNKSLNLNGVDSNTSEPGNALSKSAVSATMQ